MIDSSLAWLDLCRDFRILPAPKPLRIAQSLRPVEAVEVGVECGMSGLFLHGLAAWLSTTPESSLIDRALRNVADALISQKPGPMWKRAFAFIAERAPAFPGQLVLAARTGSQRESLRAGFASCCSEAIIHWSHRSRWDGHAATIPFPEFLSDGMRNDLRTNPESGPYEFALAILAYEFGEVVASIEALISGSARSFPGELRQAFLTMGRSDALRARMSLDTPLELDVFYTTISSRATALFRERMDCGAAAPQSLREFAETFEHLCFDPGVRKVHAENLTFAECALSGLAAAAPDAGTLLALARFALYRDRVDDARRHFAQALRLAPQSLASPHLTFGHWLAYGGHRNLAEEELCRGIAEADSDTIDIAFLTASLAAHLGRIEIAGPILSRIQRQRPAALAAFLETPAGLQLGRILAGAAGEDSLAEVLRQRVVDLDWRYFGHNRAIADAVSLTRRVGITSIDFDLVEAFTPA